MKVRYHVINAFTSRPFSGNPAGVCPLDAWLPDDVMQKIAAENDLSETAFFVKDGNAHRLRWFAPAGEVDLCGHATLAAAHLLFHELGVAETTVRFETKSGRLEVERDGNRLVMNFPTIPFESETPPEALVDGVGLPVVEALAGMDHVAVLGSEAEVKNARPNLAMLATLDLRGVVLTARGSSADYVCRCFAPRFGIAEDPVTGSVQCVLAPYWAERLKKSRFSVRQLSARGGDMVVELKGSRVLIAGEARSYLSGTIEV